MLGVTINYLNQFVYWKKAVAIKPTITAKIKPTQYFTENEFETIAQEVYNYANNIKLGDSIDADQIFIAILEADPEFKGQRTYSVSASNVSVASTDNPDTYYEYSMFSFNKETDGTYTLTIQ